MRWKLVGGHPAGTRVLLTQRGPARLAGDRPRALAAWHAHLDLLAGRLRGEIGRAPQDRAAELEAHYAERAGERAEAR